MGEGGVIDLAEKVILGYVIGHNLTLISQI